MKIHLEELKHQREALDAILGSMPPLAEDQPGNNTFMEGGYGKLIELYPELLQTQVKGGKIISPSIKDARPKIKLRKDNWKKIADFWKEVSKRYLLSFERLDESELAELVESVLETEGVFDDNRNVSIAIKDTRKNADGGGVSIEEKTMAVANPCQIGKLQYGEFVRRLAERTAIPVKILHSKLWGVLDGFVKNGLDNDDVNAKLNVNSLEKVIAVWDEKFAETYAAKYDYDPLNYTAETSVIKGGGFISEIEAGLIGKTVSNNIADDPRNLYEPPCAYDSEIEREVETHVPRKQIAVFGKVPRKAIKVPTYTGGSTTPDFVYVTEEMCIGKRDCATGESGHPYEAGESAGKGRLALLVETKAADMRGAEGQAVAAQEKLFRKIPGVKWKLLTSAKEIHAALEELCK